MFIGASACIVTAHYVKIPHLLEGIGKVISQDRLDRLPDEFSSEYYLLGGTVPVRVLVARADGLYAGAIAPDRQTGAMCWRNDLLSRVQVSDEVEKIDAPTFEKLCASIVKAASGDAQAQ